MSTTGPRMATNVLAPPPVPAKLTFMRSHRPSTFATTPQPSYAVYFYFTVHTEGHARA